MQLEHIPCNLCGADDSEFMFEGKDLWHGTERTGRQRFRVVRCRRCGLAYVTPRIPRDHIGLYYPANYAAHSGASTPSASLSPLGRRALRWRQAQYEQWQSSKSRGPWPQATLQRLFGHTRRARYDPFRFRGEGRRILDIGCGAGNYLADKKSLGWDIYGIDISANAVASCHAQGLANVRQGQFTADLWQPACFSVVTMRHVLEHTADPKGLLQQVHLSLKPNGVLYIQVPNFASITARVFGSYWFGLDIPRHYYFFSPHTLTRLLRETGYRVISWYTLSSTSDFTAGLEFVARECLGLNVDRDRIRKNRFLSLLMLPVVRFSDWVKLGGSLHVLALKPA